MSRIEIYYNLRKKLFSVRRDGKVHTHVPCVLIREPRFVVQEGGRRRVLRERRKNVHAFVTAKSLDHLAMCPAGCFGDTTFGWDRVSYNPYLNDTFVRASNRGDRTPGEYPIHDAPWAMLTVSYGIPKVEAMVGGDGPFDKVL